MAAAAELEASEAAKRKAKEEEERKTKKDAAATAAPPGAKRQERIVAPVPERGTSGARVATGLSEATAGPPAMTGGGSGGGGGGASLVVDMSLEVRLKKAIERGVSRLVVLQEEVGKYIYIFIVKFLVRAPYWRGRGVLDRGCRRGRDEGLRERGERMQHRTRI